MKKRKSNTDIHTGRMSCEDEGRDGSDALYAKECQRLSAKHQKLGVRHEADFPSKY